MPGFDGTGPRGGGPLTGRGEGYCVLPLGGSRRASPTAGLARRPLLRRWWAPVRWFRPFAGRGLGRGRGMRAAMHASMRRRRW